MAEPACAKATAGVWYFAPLHSTATATCSCLLWLAAAVTLVSAAAYVLGERDVRRTN